MNIINDDYWQLTIIHRIMWVDLFRSIGSAWNHKKNNFDLDSDFALAEFHRLMGK